MNNDLPSIVRLAFAIPVALAAGFAFSGSTDQTPTERKVDLTVTYHEVSIKEFAFHPATIDVNAGDVVTWTNHDFVPHTATALDNSWDSGMLVQGASFSLVVEKDAVLDYYCFFHPMMKAMLAVQH